MSAGQGLKCHLICQFWLLAPLHGLVTSRRTLHFPPADRLRRQPLSTPCYFFVTE